MTNGSEPTLTDITQQLQAIQTCLGEMDQKIEQRLERLELRFKFLEIRFDNIEKRFTNLDRSLTERKLVCP